MATTGGTNERVGLSQHVGAPSGIGIPDRPPRPPGPDGGTTPGGPRPRWSRRRLVLLGLGVASLVVVLLVLLVPTSLVDRVTRRSVSGYGGSCAELLGIDVDSGDWPVIARAATGHYSGVSTHVDELRLDGFSYYDVSFSADRIDVAPLFGVLSDRQTTVHGGEASATVRYEDIEAAIAEAGSTVDLTVQGSSLVANVDVPFLGPVPTTVDITPVEGDMQIVFAPLDMIELPPITVPFPAPTRLREVVVEDDALQVDSTVDGTLRSGDFGCDASSNVAS
jgi:hypothetical protein